MGLFLSVLIHNSYRDYEPAHSAMPRAYSDTCCCRNTTTVTMLQPVILISALPLVLSVYSLVYERTTRNPAECSGVGLHSGAPVHLRILPAPAGTGIVFRRIDLDGFLVEASSR